MRAKTQEDFNVIRDCMAGADGGISFAYLKSFLEDFDEKAENGDKAAQQLVDVMSRFSRLITVSDDLAKKDQEKKKSARQE